MHHLIGGFDGDTWLRDAPRDRRLRWGYMAGDGRGIQPPSQHVALMPADEAQPQCCGRWGRRWLAGRWSSVAAAMEYGGPGVASAVAYTAETGWIPLPPLPHATEEATACVLDGKLYVAGGGGCGKL